MKRTYTNVGKDEASHEQIDEAINTKNCVQINILILEKNNCFLDKSHTFKVPVDKLRELIEFIKSLQKRG